MNTKIKASDSVTFDSTILGLVLHLTPPSMTQSAFLVPLEILEVQEPVLIQFLDLNHTNAIDLSLQPIIREIFETRIMT